jgi:cytochrome c-type biogenesis protein
MTELALAYLAGLLTTLSPCVLPMIPLVLAGTLRGGRLGPVAFAAGMVVSFTVVGLFVASVGIGLGINEHLLRQIAAVMFVAMGAFLLIAPLQARLAMATAGIASGANLLADRVDVGGLAGPFLVGTLAGAIWSPCSGPSLGAAIALAAEAGGFATAALRMAAFGVGAATILLALAYGSRSAIMGRRNRMMAAASWLKPAAGAAFVLVGCLILFGGDKRLEALLVDWSPDWLVDVTTRY